MMCTSKIRFTVFPIFLSLLMTYGCRPSGKERSRVTKSDETTSDTKEVAAAVGDLGDVGDLEDVESMQEIESAKSGTEALAMPESIPEGSTGLELTASLSIGTSGTLRTQPSALGLTSSGFVRMCTKEVKPCADGSGVGRTGPNCEPAPCPGEAVVELIDATMNIANIRFFANRKPTSEEEKGIKQLKEKLKSNAAPIIAGLHRVHEKHSPGVSPEKAKEILDKAKTTVAKDVVQRVSKDFFRKLKGPGCDIEDNSGESLQKELADALSIGKKNLKFLEKPWLFNVSHPEPMDPDLFKGKLKDGGYNRIDFHLVPYLTDKAHKMFCKSLRVEGTFQRDDREIPFILEASTPMHIQLASDADKSLRIENEGSNILISFDTNKWFEGVDMATALVTKAEDLGSLGIIVLSETENMKLFHQVVKNIRRSAVFALDADGDQQVSESEKIGESSVTEDP